jgi:hypothetical protein
MIGPATVHGSLPRIALREHGFVQGPTNRDVDESVQYSESFPTRIILQGKRLQTQKMMLESS